MRKAYKIIAFFLLIFLVGILSSVVYINNAYESSEVKSVDAIEQHTETTGAVFYSFR